MLKLPRLFRLHGLGTTDESSTGPLFSLTSPLLLFLSFPCLMRNSTNKPAYFLASTGRHDYKEEFKAQGILLFLLKAENKLTTLSRLCLFDYYYKRTCPL
ncbi:hypothetical protein VNO77_46228 [Canavalia gladiata]|uniref:Uncharacterized protein n=1 Tax=Canavalia gladiata TaxID=3824 RepID=A0AAN9PHY9_CANGL